MTIEISKVIESTRKNNFAKENKKTYYSKPNNIEFQSQPQVSFKGNINKIGKNILNDAGLSKKLGRITEEVVASAKEFFIKVTHKNKMPYSEKPQVSYYTLVELSDPNTKSNPCLRSTFEHLKNANLKIDPLKDDVFDINGFLSMEGMTKLSNDIMDGKNLNTITQKEDLESLKDQLENIKEARYNVTTHVPSELKNYINSLSSRIKDLDGISDTTSAYKPIFGARDSKITMDDFIAHGDSSDTFDASLHGQSVADELAPHGVTDTLNDAFTSMEPDLAGIESSVPKGQVFNFDDINIEKDPVVFEGLSQAAEKSQLLSNSLDELSKMTEILDNPIIDAVGTVAAEAPVIRFFKPIQDAINGKYEDAFAGALTRGAELGASVATGGATALAKLGLNILGGVVNVGNKILGNTDASGTGFYEGWKNASDLWNEGRTHIENKIIGRPDLDPAAAWNKTKQAREERSKQIEAEVRQMFKERRKQLTIAHEIEMAAYEKTISSERQSLKSAQQLHVQTVKQIEKLDTQAQNLDALAETVTKLKASQEKLFNDYQAKVLIIREELKNADKTNDLRRKAIIEEAFANLHKDFIANADEAMKYVNKAIRSTTNHKKMFDLDNAKGFGRIAGYGQQKNNIMQIFQQAIIEGKKGKSAQVPSLILLHGPIGTGKSQFAIGLADELDCAKVSILPTANTNKDYENLKNAAINAENLFQNEKKRTIIIMDEFNIIAPNGSKAAEKINEFISTMSEKYHCTIIATTNYPERISGKILKNNNTIIQDFPPASRSDIISILKHYIRPFTGEKIDYHLLAEKLFKAQPNEAYSNSKIKNTIYNLVESEKELNQENIKKAFDKKAPDIHQKDLLDFNKHIQDFSNL